jgi:ABC-type antimicrobial peptide transport system permease subunit
MGVALSLTLILTGFACAFVAMAIPKTTTERGVVLLTAVSLAVFQPWVGMLIGVAATILLVGPAAHHKPDDSVPI